jgi:tetratricopeptide (TPR) repeat protein
MSSYPWLTGFRRLFPLIAVGSYVLCAATAVLALPPDLERQVRSGNLTRQEAEQLAAMSGGSSSSATPSSAPAPAPESPTTSQPEEQAARPKVNEKALLDKANKIIADDASDERKLYEAKGYIEKVLAANPRNALAYVYMARLALAVGYVGGGDYEPRALGLAHATLDKALKLNPRLFEAYMLGGKLALIENDLSTAKKMTAMAEKIKPGTPEVEIRYARIANDEHNPDEAITLLSRAIHKPLNQYWREAAYEEFIDAYKAKKEYKLVDHYYQSLLEIDPSPATKINYAVFLGCSCGGGDPQNRDYDKAIRYAESALKDADFYMAHKTLGELYFNRAIARNNQGNKNWAISDFKESAKHYRTNEDKESYQRVEAKMKESNLGVL